MAAGAETRDTVKPAGTRTASGGEGSARAGCGMVKTGATAEAGMAGVTVSDAPAGTRVAEGRDADGACSKAVSYAT